MLNVEGCTLFLSLSEMCPAFIVYVDCAQALKVNTSSITGTRHVCSVTELVEMLGLGLLPVPSLYCLSWPIWHRGGLCKALRAWQRPIYLRSREPLPWSSVMLWELFEFWGVPALCFVCIWATIREISHCLQTSFIATFAMLPLLRNYTLKWKNGCMLQVKIWLLFNKSPEISFFLVLFFFFLCVCVRDLAVGLGSPSCKCQCSKPLKPDSASLQT